MIRIEDNDLPITVAEKIVKGTKVIENPSPLQKVLHKTLFSNESAEEVTEDMFSIEDIKEIADYLLVFYENNKDID